MVCELSLGWVSATQPVLDGVPDIEFSTSTQGEIVHWQGLRRRYVGQLVWVKNGSPEALEGVVEVGSGAGRLAGAVIAGQWGSYAIHPDLGRAVAFHIPRDALHTVELCGRRARDRSLHIRLANGDQLTFVFELVIGNSRKWRAKLNDELAGDFVSGMYGVPVVRWVQAENRPDVRIAG